MTYPLVVEIQTRLRADWAERCDQSGLSKAKAATFIQDAALLPFTSQPIRAAILAGEAVDASMEIFYFTCPDDYGKFLAAIAGPAGMDQYAATAGDNYRNAKKVRLIGRDLVDKLRIVVANYCGLAQPGIIKPWMWYSHFFAPGCIVDPYLDFLESDSRAVTSWESFCTMVLGQRMARMQGGTEEAEVARLQQATLEIRDVSRHLGIM